MRLLSLIFLAALLGFAIANASSVSATGMTVMTADSAVLAQSSPVSQHDGSRVGVQLVVAGIAAGLVVGVGTGAYLLRRKLGRTAYSPENAGGGHH